MLWNSVLMTLNEKNKRSLLDLAYRSIEMGFKTGNPLNINLRDYSTELAQQRATFVTLKTNKQLRGSIGMLEAVLPLAEDVVENAFAAAFNDPRFSPLQASEFNNLDIQLSILSPSIEVQFVSEEDLISKIRPDVDGLILESGKRRGNFLPTVWQTIPKPDQFLQHLKQKAGLEQNYWSNDIKIYRYTTELIN